MRAHLASRFPHLNPAIAISLVTASLLTAATGASAVTVRMSGNHATHVIAAAHHPVTLSLPAPPAPAGPAPGANDAFTATPTVAKIARPKRLIEATLLVTQPTALRTRQITALKELSGVRRAQTVSAGEARVDGHKSFVLGVDPTRFRPWTPRLTSGSQALWQSIAAGELTASFDMGHDAQLPLGATVLVHSRATVPMRIGAFASVGMAGVDAVVSAHRATKLGLTPNTGILISAPHADVVKLRDAVRSIVTAHSQVLLLREVIIIRDSGEFMTRLQINTILQAAASRVGKPYVWGATGPDAFDCSGLVQWSFAHAGIQMPRVSQQQWFAGPHIPLSAARPGDLLFWHYDPTDPADIDHVAIYAGNGMMLVAPHTGQYVEYVAVPTNNLAGVVRVDPAIAAQV